MDEPGAGAGQVLLVEPEPGRLAGAQVCRKTSASATVSATARRPAAVRMSISRTSLPALSAANRAETPPARGAAPRAGSPPGCSIRITRAPSARRTEVASGPWRWRVDSTTVRPVRGSGRELGRAVRRGAGCGAPRSRGSSRSSQGSSSYRTSLSARRSASVRRAQMPIPVRSARSWRSAKRWRPALWARVVISVEAARVCRAEKERQLLAMSLAGAPTARQKSRQGWTARASTSNRTPSEEVNGGRAARR